MDNGGTFAGKSAFMRMSVAGIATLVALVAFCAEPELAPLGPHPRLFADAAEFESAKARISSTEAGKKA